MFQLKISLMTNDPVKDCNFSHMYSCSKYFGNITDICSLNVDPLCHKPAIQHGLDQHNLMNGFTSVGMAEKKNQGREWMYGKSSTNGEKGGRACVEHTKKQQKKNKSISVEGRRKERDETGRVVPVMIILAPV